MYLDISIHVLEKLPFLKRLEKNSFNLARSIFIFLIEMNARIINLDTVYKFSLFLKYDSNNIYLGYN